MQGWAWWTLSAPLGVFGIPSSCTRRVVLVATLGTRCSKSSYASLRKRAESPRQLPDTAERPSSTPATDR